MVAVLSNSSNDLSTRGIVIEIPLKPRKKMISLRIDEEALIVLDRFTAIYGEYSRTLLITKVIEALAKGLKETDYKACKLQLNFIVEESNGSSNKVSIVIPLRSREK